MDVRVGVAMMNLSVVDEFLTVARERALDLCISSVTICLCHMSLMRDVWYFVKKTTST